MKCPMDSSHGKGDARVLLRSKKLPSPSSSQVETTSARTSCRLLSVTVAITSSRDKLAAIASLTL